MVGNGNSPPAKNLAVSPETAVRVGSAKVFAKPTRSSASMMATAVLPFQLADGFVSEHVLNFFRVIMHMVGGDPGGVGEVKLPHAMVANDFARALPAGGGEIHGLAGVVAGGESMADNFARKLPGLPFGFAALIGEFAERHIVAFELAAFEDLIERLERVLPACAALARALPPPAGNSLALAMHH